MNIVIVLVWLNLIFVTLILHNALIEKKKKNHKLQKLLDDVKFSLMKNNCSFGVKLCLFFFFLFFYHWIATLSEEVYWTYNKGLCQYQHECSGGSDPKNKISYYSARALCSNYVPSSSNFFILLLEDSIIWQSFMLCGIECWVACYMFIMSKRIDCWDPEWQDEKG